MLWISNFNVKEGKMKELQQFIKDNEATKAAHAPKGWKYRGTYLYVCGFGSYHGMMIWEITDYADFDIHRKHDDPIYWNIMEQFLELTTSEPTAGWLLREAGDTRITEKEKDTQ